MSRRAVLALILGIALAWPAFQSVSDSLIRARWFQLTDDEAIFAELTEHYTQKGEYRTWNSEFFHPAHTTGPTVILPASLIQEKYSFTSAEAGRVTLIGYHLLLVLILGFLCERYLRYRDSHARVSGAFRWVFILMIAGVFHWGWRGYQDGGYYIFGIMGEGAAAFFTVLAIYSVFKESFFIAGLAASLACLSKPYFLFIPAGLVLSVFLSNPKKLVSTFLGTTTPFLWMFWVIQKKLGFDGTVEWFLNYPKAMRQINGGGISANYSFGLQYFIDAVTTHARGLRSFMNIRSILLALVGFGFFVYTVKRYFKDVKLRTFFVFLGVTSLIHTAWWFLVSPRIEARYLFPALILMWVGFALAFTHPLRRLILRFRTARGMVFVSLIALIVLFGKFGYQVRSEWKSALSSPETCPLCRQLEIQSFWKNLGEDRPEVVLASSRSYGGDTDLLLTAPHRIISFIPGKTPIDKRWIVVSHQPQDGTGEFLLQKNCTAKIRPSQRHFDGIWECP